MFAWLQKLTGWGERLQEPKPEAPNDDTADNPKRSLLSTHGSELARTRSWNVATRLQEFAKLRPTQGAAISADGSVAAMDSTDTGESDSNLLKGYMRGQPGLSDALSSWYASQSFIGHQLSALMAQHWLIAKACALPARDAIRNGFTITSADGEPLDPKIMQALKRADKRYGLKRNMLEYIREGRVFGIRIVIFKVDYGDDAATKAAYLAPFNIDGVRPGAYKGMVQIDPYWCSPELDGDAAAQPDTMHFYEPTWWQINGMRYHRTHLMIFRNGALADFLKPAYQYGGIPVPQLIAERVYGAERTANEAPLLALTKRTNVYKTDVAQALTKFESFSQKMANMMELWTNFGVRVIGTDDDVTQLDTSLSDLDSVIMTQYQLVASAANVPATKLLGTAPKGFNATGEFDESSYHEELESLQEHDITPLVERHHKLSIKSLGLGDIVTTIAWEALDSPTAKEAAEINLIKAQTAKALVEGGSIDGMDDRLRLADDKHSGYPALNADKQPAPPPETAHMPGAPATGPQA